MSIRKWAMLAAVAALGLLAIGVSAASATTVLRTDPGNSLLTGSTTITNTSASSATLTLGASGSVHCNQTFFDADVNANHGASSITGTLTTLTFTTCTDSLALVTIPSCVLSPGTTPSIHIVANDAPGGSVEITDPLVRCSIAGSTTSFCYYTGTNVVGNALNIPSTLTYSSINVDLAGGSGSLGAACGSPTGNFTVQLNHIVQGGTNRTITITTS